MSSGPEQLLPLLSLLPLPRRSALQCSTRWLPSCTTVVSVLPMLTRPFPSPLCIIVIAIVTIQTCIPLRQESQISIKLSPKKQQPSKPDFATS